jgi:pimeloyl-ACP methyl ester carboxylesterase
MPRSFKSLFLATALMGTTGCFVPTEGRGGSAAVDAVVIDSLSINIAIGQTARLQASVRDGNGFPVTGRAVQWVSSDTSIANVNDDGEVTGIAAGTAVVSAIVDGFSGATQVAVPAKVTANKLIGQSGGTVEIATGTSISIAPGILPNDAVVEITETGGPLTPLSDTTRSIAIAIRSPFLADSEVPITLQLHIASPPPANTRGLARVTYQGDSLTRYFQATDPDAAAGQAGVPTYVRIAFSISLEPNKSARLVWAALTKNTANECATVNDFQPYDKVSVPAGKQAIVLIHGWQPQYWCSIGALQTNILDLIPFKDFHPESTWAAAAAELRRQFPTVPIFLVRYPTTLRPSFAADYVSARLSAIDAATPNTKYVLVGHSMGGLLARYVDAVEARAGRSRIAGIITLGTPHLGTPAAGWLTPSEGVDWLAVNKVEDDLPLPTTAPLYALAGGLACNENPHMWELALSHQQVFCHFAHDSKVVSDGIVPTCSAVPTSQPSSCRAVTNTPIELRLDPPPTQIDHTDLVKDPSVLALVVNTIRSLLPSSSGDYEPNDTPVSATPIAPGETQIHSMTAGDVDWLSLTITQPSAVELTLTGSSNADHVHDFDIYDATGTRLLASAFGIPSRGITVRLSSAPPGARVRICADDEDGACDGGPGDLSIGSYQVTLAVLSSPFLSASSGPSGSAGRLKASSSKQARLPRP